VSSTRFLTNFSSFNSEQVPPRPPSARKCGCSARHMRGRSRCAAAHARLPAPTTHRLPGATILVVVTPHQFIGKQLPLLKSVIAPTCHAISLIKVCPLSASRPCARPPSLQQIFGFNAAQGIEFEGHNIRLISSIIRCVLHSRVSHFDRVSRRCPAKALAACTAAC